MIVDLNWLPNNLSTRLADKYLIFKYDIFNI